VNEVDVHNDGSEQEQAERDEAPDKQQQAADDLEYGDNVKVMTQERALVKSPTSPGDGGGIGMKCKKIFEPNTTKISPRRTRAIMVAIFIEGSWLDREGIQ